MTESPLMKRRGEILAEAKGIAERAKAEKRDFTAEEGKKVEGLLAEVDQIDERRKGSKGADALLAKIGGGRPGADERGFLSLRSAPESILASVADRGPAGVKALLQTGTDAVAASMVESPVAEGKPATGLLDVLPARTVTPAFFYLRQNARDNAAAPVADGGTKPTSTYGLERVDGTLEVVAHVSEPISEYWLQDAPALRDFLKSEMSYGLQVALEDEALNGTGTSPSLAGIAQTSGVQTQAFATDAIVTTREAVGKVEAVGSSGGAFVLHPDDWKALELTTTTQGEYLFLGPGAPIDRAARRLWGVPVALSTATTAGTAYLIGAGAVELLTDGNVRWQFGVTGDGFAKNEVIARLETRAQVAVTRPQSVVKVDLTAA